MNGLGSSETFDKYIDMVTLLLARKSCLVDRKPQVSNQNPPLSLPKLSAFPYAS